MTKYNNVSLDAGNANIKLIAGQFQFLATACLYKLQPHEIRRAKGTPQSPLVNCGEGDYLIGDLAIDRLGTNNFATSDKLHQAKLFLFAALPPAPLLEIDRLLVAVPDDYASGQQEHLDKLLGVHEYTRNGQLTRLIVKTVVPVAETYSAYLAALDKKLFSDPRRRNGIITIGGGTLNLALLDSAGSILPEYSCVVPKGLRSLALSISAAIASESNVSVGAAEIMSAIGRGEYTASRSDFSSVFESCRQAWIASIRATIIEKWASQINDIGEVVGTGAPIELLSDYFASRDRFQIAPDPQWFAVKGMQLF